MGRAADHYEQLQVRTRAALRRWLQQNHARSSGIWVVTFKQGTGKGRVSSADIAEEALCFGWIDSLPRALDEERSMLLVTPRKPRSNWSRLNKELAERLIAAGLMTPAGLAAVALARRSGTWSALDEVERLALPDDLAQRFEAAAPAARANFDAFPRSVRRGILEWILSAKRPETRARRIDETVTQAARNVRANQWR